MPSDYNLPRYIEYARKGLIKALDERNFEEATQIIDRLTPENKPSDEIIRIKFQLAGYRAITKLVNLGKTNLEEYAALGTPEEIKERGLTIEQLQEERKRLEEYQRNELQEIREALIT